MGRADPKKAPLLTPADQKRVERVRLTNLTKGPAAAKALNLALPEVYRKLGIRQEAIETVLLCIQDRENDRPTPLALKASEHVLEYTDPKPKNAGEDIRSGGGEIKLHVHWDRPPAVS